MYTRSTTSKDETHAFLCGKGAPAILWKGGREEGSFPHTLEEPLPVSPQKKMPSFFFQENKKYQTKKNLGEKFNQFLAYVL